VKIVVIFCVLIGTFATSQVLDNRNGEAFTDRPFFNQNFIKQNNLKQLTGSFVYKKTGELMKTTKYKYVYEFDSLGHLISTYETRADDGTSDTTWNYYIYDELDQLLIHRKTDQEGFTSVHNEFDSLGRIISEEFKRDIIGDDNIIERSLTFNKEKIVYVDYEKQTKSTRYNNYGLPYLDEYYNYNDLGYLVEHIERIKMTSSVYASHYEYNREGRLAAIRKSSNQEDGYIEELLFDYDALGNLIEKHIYKNGVFTTDIQIIYNSKSKLLATVITRQVSTGFMMILRFKDYIFFD
jgi:hypothetical protein